MTDEVSHPVAQITLRGVTYDVYTKPDWDAGLLFFMTYEGTEISAPDFRKLKARLGNLSRGRRVQIPFYDTRTGRSGVATGIHVNKNILITWDDGQSAQMSSFNARCIELPTPEDLAVYRLMRRQRDEVEQAIVNFEAEHRLNLRIAVRTAIEKLSTASPDE